MASGCIVGQHVVLILEETMVREPSAAAAVGGGEQENGHSGGHAPTDENLAVARYNDERRAQMAEA